LNKTAVTAARNNAQTAGVDHLIEFDICPYEKTSIPEDGGINYFKSALWRTQ